MADEKPPVVQDAVAAGPAEAPGANFQPYIQGMSVLSQSAGFTGLATAMRAAGAVLPEMGSFLSQSGMATLGTAFQTIGTGKDTAAGTAPAPTDDALLGWENPNPAQGGSSTDVDQAAKLRDNLPASVFGNPEADKMDIKLGNNVRTPKADELLKDGDSAKFSSVDDASKADIVFNKDGSITLNTNISKPLSEYKVFNENGKEATEKQNQFLALLAKGLDGKVESDAKELRDGLSKGCPNGQCGGGQKDEADKIDQPPKQDLSKQNGSNTPHGGGGEGGKLPTPKDNLDDQDEDDGDKTTTDGKNGSGIAPEAARNAWKSVDNYMNPTEWPPMAYQQGLASMLPQAFLSELAGLDPNDPDYDKKLAALMDKYKDDLDKAKEKLGEDKNDPDSTKTLKDLANKMTDKDFLASPEGKSMVESFTKMSDNAKNGNLTDADVNKFVDSTGLNAKDVKSALAHKSIVNEIQSKDRQSDSQYKDKDITNIDKGSLEQLLSDMRAKFFLDNMKKP